MIIMDLNEWESQDQTAPEFLREIVGLVFYLGIMKVISSGPMSI